MTGGLREREEGRERGRMQSGAGEGGAVVSSGTLTHIHTHRVSCSWGQESCHSRNALERGQEGTPVFFHLYLFDDVIDQWS